MADGQRKISVPKDGVALVLGGIFILTLVFIAYRYFNKPIDTTSQEEDTSLLDLFEEDQEETNNETGDLNGSGATDERPLGTGGTVAGSETTAMLDNTWVANDYKQGDITGSSYTVQSGDTLWEIAEAAYGNGGDWVRILDANTSTVGFLANGQQSLIHTGQVLTIPR